MASRGMTPIIASHNLRELEDICDHVGLLHKGGLLLSKELEEMKLSVHKLQVVFDHNKSEDDFPALDIISNKFSGRLQTMVIRGDEEQILQQIQAANPIFIEMLPLSLEEVFITETEVVGYEFPPSWPIISASTCVRNCGSRPSSCWPSSLPCRSMPE